MSFTCFLRKEKFHHYFQPIYNLHTFEKLGKEALIRSSSYPNPEMIFQKAKIEESLYELDSRSINKAISTYQSATQSTDNEYLFLNVLPSTILNHDFPAFLDLKIHETQINSKQIVLEISESETIEDFDTFKTCLSKIKSLGFLIAIDDVGVGYTNVKSLIELEADYLKLDGYFSQNLNVSRKKQSFIAFYVNYCKQYKSKLIIEGLETIEDLAMAKRLGVDIGQGYLLGKPAMIKKSI